MEYKGGVNMANKKKPRITQLIEIKFNDEFDHYSNASLPYVLHHCMKQVPDYKLKGLKFISFSDDLNGVTVVISY